MKQKRIEFTNNCRINTFSQKCKNSYGLFQKLFVHKMSMPNPIPEIDIRHGRFYHWLKIMVLKAPINCKREGYIRWYKVIYRY